MLDPAGNIIKHGVGKAGNIANRKNIVTNRTINSNRAHGVIGENTITQIETGAFEPFGVGVRADSFNKDITGEFFARVEQHSGDIAFAEQVGDRCLHFESNALGFVTTLKLAS